MTRMGVRLWVAALCLAWGCESEVGAGLPMGDPSAATAALDFSRFDQAVQAFLDQNALSGASAVIVHKDLGLVHSKGYGQFAADRLYLIASSSKILSVGVLMRLVEQGKLDLDAPVSNYLGVWGSFKSDITTAQLVSNSSGLVGLTDNPTYAPYICQYLDAGTLSACAQMIYTATDTAERKPPDTAFRYGGGQWQLAGGIAEVVSGKNWKQLIDEAYVQTCGATSLGYTNQFAKASASGNSTAYPAFFQTSVANLPVTQNPSVEGGAYISAPDYAKLLLMHLRGGLCEQTRVLSEASVTRMRDDRIARNNVATPSPALAGYGLGWWVDRGHPGVVADPGAYGAFPWLDLPRGYGAMLMLESSSMLGAQLWAAVKPSADAVFDARTGGAGATAP